MATPRVRPELHPSVLMRLNEARARTDSLFDLLPPNSFYARPIPERHRLIFYLGHLEAFDWNLLSSALGLESNDPSFDKLFAFGIDPIGRGLPKDRPGDWPGIAQVERYNRQVRDRLDAGLAEGKALAQSHEDRALDETLLHVAIEHRLMHAETLAYLLHNLPLEKKILHPGVACDPRPSPRPRSVTIPAGTATLGQSCGPRANFGWDNEFGREEIQVPSFAIDAFPVTNSEFMKFVRAGGYEDSHYWRLEDWDWIRHQRIEHPHFWVARSSSPATDPDTQWEYRAMFGAIPLPPSWPVYVSFAEASAYANWAHQKLPTEAQWHRAAYGSPGGTERRYPWGETLPDSTRGNFHFERWDPTAVDAHSDGASSFGVQDLVGNGWEWTSTPFGPLQGFEPFPFYRGYSADFFDGRHFVVKGGSPRTDACMLRRSFRNWFQPHYPYLYTKFRCVEE